MFCFYPQKELQIEDIQYSNFEGDNHAQYKKKCCNFSDAISESLNWKYSSEILEQ